jgi:hypothetical protein
VLAGICAGLFYKSAGSFAGYGFSASAASPRLGLKPKGSHISNHVTKNCNNYLYMVYNPEDCSCIIEVCIVESLVYNISYK